VVFSEFERNCNCKVFLPNAFSPNDDGINDIFLPQTPCEMGQYELLIANRWGAVDVPHAGSKRRVERQIPAKNGPGRGLCLLDAVPIFLCCDAGTGKRGVCVVAVSHHY